MIKKRKTVSRRIFLAHLFAVFFVALSFSILAQARMIRKVKVSSDQVTEVHTAIGYSTILEFPSKPLSAVLGDQDAFKLEFVGNSITVKPLLARAKSNLFVFTEFDRFNCQLTTGGADQVDYIVSLSRISEVSETPGIDSDASDPLHSYDDSTSKVIPVHRFRSYSGVKLTIVSMTRTESRATGRSTTLLDVELESKSRSTFFSPSALGVKEGGHFIPVESIYLDALELSFERPIVHGKIALLGQDRKGGPLSVVFAISDPKAKSKAYRLEVSAEPRRQKRSAAKKAGG